MRLGFDYFRGIEFRWGLGPSVNSGLFAVALQPILGLKGAGTTGGHSLRESVLPQIGLRVRADYSIATSLLLTLSAGSFFFESFKPEDRIEAELIWRLNRWVPFIRYRKIVKSNEPTLNNISLGLAIGV